MNCLFKLKARVVSALSLLGLELLIESIRGSLCVPEEKDTTGLPFTIV